MKEKKKGGISSMLHKIACLVVGITSLGSTFIAQAADNTAFLTSVNHLLLCQDGCGISYTVDDPKYNLTYKGLSFYKSELPHTQYQLPQLSESEFNRLTIANKRKVADKLLTSLFFGYPFKELEAKIASGHFLCSVRKGLTQEKNNMAAVEEEILNEERYYHSEWANNEVLDILARFYAMKHLDKHYLNNWIAYILTQNILFSPAYELDTSHDPNTATVYNGLVMDLNDDVGMRYSTYLHMTSSDNWRRFRSPEDNGREMLEIYTLDFDDTHVPKAAKTLQNWYLDEEADTLVIGLNENTIPQQLFGTTVITGFDYYRELAKSKAFTAGSVRRLVDFFFTEHSDAEKTRITNQIVAGAPETWQDILLQIVFSEEFLLHTQRPISAEELIYSLMKKLDYKHNTDTFYYFNEALKNMNQASMKYKLGKLERTPLDTLSFAYYHKYVRETIMRRSVCGAALNSYISWNSYGWRPELVDSTNFALNINNPESSLTSLITYLFAMVVHRSPTTAELELFKNSMLNANRSAYLANYNFLHADDDGCYYWRANAAEDILDYLSRLTDLYMFQEVQQ
jgi:hypothetical protein